MPRVSRERVTRRRRSEAPRAGGLTPPPPAAWIVDGVDLRRELRRLWRLRCWAALDHPPEFVLRRSRTKKDTTGRATWLEGLSDRRIVITLGAGADRASALYTLLHEICHHAHPSMDHGPDFYACLSEAMTIAWPGLRIPSGRARVRTYCLDVFLEATLRFHLAGSDDWSANPPGDPGGAHLLIPRNAWR